MAQFPAMPLWTDAYLGDTLHLTLEEHGAYLNLLMIAWRSPNCDLPDDDARLATMLGIGPKKWGRLRPTIIAFWESADGRLTQKKLLEVRFRVKEVQNRQSSNARARYLKIKETTSATAEPRLNSGTANQNQNQNQLRNKEYICPQNDELINKSFTEFWAVFPSRSPHSSSKALALTRFQSAVKRGFSVEEIIRGAVNYADSMKKTKTDPLHICQAATWLNQQRWEQYQAPIEIVVKKETLGVM